MTKQKARIQKRVSGHILRPGAMIRLLWPERNLIAACTVLQIFGKAISILPYIIIAEIAYALFETDGVFPAERIWLWVAVFVFCACLPFVFSYLSMILGHHAFAKLLCRVQRSIVEKLKETPLGWFKSNGAASVKKAMTNDLSEMEGLVIDSLREPVGALAGLTVSLYYMFSVNITMASIAAVTLALQLTFYCVAMRSQTMHQANLLAAQGRIGTASVEYAEGAAVVKIFGAEGSFTDRFEAAIEDFIVAMRTWVRETRYSTAASYILASEVTIFGLMMIAGLYLVSEGKLFMVEMIPFLTVGLGLPAIVLPAIHGVQGIRTGRACAGRIDDILQMEPMSQPSAPQTPTGKEVEFKNVSFSYDGVNKALENVSAVLKPGYITALVGPSGAGKTTLANLLPRFYDVDEGSVEIGGVDIRDVSQKNLLSMMALVFQDIILIHDSILENIRLGKPDASDTEVVEAAKAANIHHVIEAMHDGYHTVLGSDSGGLSGGEQQRLTIARAILSNAPLVILDEATASLDTDNEEEVQKALSRLAEGKTMLVIAHRLNTIREADQILVLDKGRIIERGTHTHLMDSNGLYASMWREQEKGETLQC
jgi:ATP-binding cassette subfamily B protein